MEGKSRKPFLVTEEILASHGQRLANYVVDMVMLLVLMFFVLVFISAIAISNNNKEFMDKLPTNTVAIYTITIGVTLFYYNIFEIFSARTIGKLITQTIVVDENGNIPNHESILIRSLCRFIPFIWLPFVISFFMGTKAKGWHDSISKTYVVNRNALEEEKRLFYISTQIKSEE